MGRCKEYLTKQQRNNLNITNKACKNIALIEVENVIGNDIINKNHFIKRKNFNDVSVISPTVIDYY